METLIKGVIITDPQSPHHGTVRDVLIQEGKIVRIDTHIDAAPSMRIWDEPGSALSVGWMDLQADFADPGQEQKEGLESGSRAAQAGGGVEHGASAFTGS
jgi:dihydroorotase